MLNILFVAFFATAQNKVTSLTDARWLTGCWKQTGSARSVTEYWLAPEAGTMLGVSRTVSGGKTVEYEFLLLRSTDTGLEYVAKPSGQPEAVFKASRVSPTELVFENPSHDFPTRIRYAKLDGGLLATIDGVIQGTPRAVEFRYTAADCSK
jgi:hypothetical protein